MSQYIEFVQYHENWTAKENVSEHFLSVIHRTVCRSLLGKNSVIWNENSGETSEADKLIALIGPG